MSYIQSNFKNEQTWWVYEHKKCKICNEFSFAGFYAIDFENSQLRFSTIQTMFKEEDGEFRKNVVNDIDRLSSIAGTGISTGNVCSYEINL